ncbi:hypothetical protein MHU86_6124 [Fragilaria crotonensis]|nr:hypothetical protein MHU86_6124 [Fragilaria crotonensis]
MPVHSFRWDLTSSCWGGCFVPPVLHFDLGLRIRCGGSFLSSPTPGSVSACGHSRANDGATHDSDQSLRRLLGALHVSTPLSVVKNICVALTWVTVASRAEDSLHTMLLFQVAGFLILLSMRTLSPTAYSGVRGGTTAEGVVGGGLSLLAAMNFSLQTSDLNPQRV